MNHAASFTPFFKDLFFATKTNFGEFLTETVDFFESRADLLARIDADLDRYGLKKKAVREADRLFLLNQTRPLQGFDNLPDSFAPPRTAPGGSALPSSKSDWLEEGRPRLPALIVAVLLSVRGYNGSCTSQDAQERMGDSISLQQWLASRGVSQPAGSTTSELLNAVSLETREAILSAQLAQALQEELDTFEKVLIDSTAARANSCWPTDAKTIFMLCQRLCANAHKLDQIGLAKVRPGRQERYREELSKLPFQINLNTRKKKKFRQFCRSFIEIASKFVCHFDKEFKRLRELWQEQLRQFLPSQRAQIQERIDLFDQSLKQAAKCIEQMNQRVFEGKSFPSTERLLSVHDESAAYIQKGGRQAVIGYKPQLARSGNGYVVALMVEKGNISDSTSFVPMVEESIANTGITPNLVNADDGYSSADNLKTVLCLGVKTVSLSGSKGKKLLGEAWDEEEYRTARADRSAVESMMFCLKHGFDFGQLSRTGLDAARQEFLEKCLAYNTCRTVLLRRRKREAHPKAA